MLRNILSFREGLIPLAILLSLTPAPSARAAQLSRNLSAGEIRKTARVLAFGALHRYWTAHALPAPGLGVEMGLESGFVFRRDLLTMGDDTAVIPRIIPVPRLWFSWELPADVIISGSFAPGMLFDGVTAAGLGGQWKFFEEPDIATNLSLAAGYTGAAAFGDLHSHSLAVSVQVSRDLVFWQPYAGAGFILNTSSVSSGVAAAGTASRYYLPGSHVYAGARIDLVAKLGLQLDLTNEFVHFSVVLGTSF